MLRKARTWHRTIQISGWNRSGSGWNSDRCLVGLFADGSFREQLKQHQIPVQVLTAKAIQVRKDSNFLQELSSFRQLLPLIYRVVKLSRDCDLIYANTQKVLIVGAIASLLSHCPLVYHLSTWFYPLGNGCIFASLQRTGLSRFAAN